MTLATSRWDAHALQLALDHAAMSKDPSRGFGSVLVGINREPVSDGFNGFPRGIYDHQHRLHDRPLKHKLVIHSEVNAILNAARRGTSTRNTTLYLVGLHKTRLEAYGSLPCIRCTMPLIQAGICEIVTLHNDDPEPPALTGSELQDWRKDEQLARDILLEAKVIFRRVYATLSIPNYIWKD